MTTADLTDLDRSVDGHALELAPTTEGSLGDPRIADRALGEVGGAEVGVWEITTGGADDTEVDEVSPPAD
jgi:hypothetical protein